MQHQTFLSFFFGYTIFQKYEGTFIKEMQILLKVLHVSSNRWFENSLETFLKKYSVAHLSNS